MLCPRRRYPLAVVLLLAVACNEGAVAEAPAAGRRAADFRSERLTPILDAADNRVQTRGFAAEGEEWRGFLVDQGSAMDEVTLHAGTCYVVAGVGSSALGELSLRIYDSDGAEVAQDAHPGANAALHYCPAHTGTYYVGALATRGTGLFAVRRYAGPTGLEMRLDDVFDASAGVGLPEGAGAERR